VDAVAFSDESMAGLLLLGALAANDGSRPAPIKKRDRDSSTARVKLIVNAQEAPRRARRPRRVRRTTREGSQRRSARAHAHVRRALQEVSVDAHRRVGE